MWLQDPEMELQPTPTSRTPCYHDQPRPDPVSWVHSTLWQKSSSAHPWGWLARMLPGAGECQGQGPKLDEAKQAGP